jgi:AraC family transcriptional activator of tynA and feaB
VAVWDVAQRPQREQFEYWHEVICQAFVPLTPSRAERGAGFAARVETRPLGQLTRARIFSQPQRTAHGPPEVARTDGAFYFVNLQVAGRCRTRQGGVESVVAPGRFVVVDTTEPYYFDFDTEWQMVSDRVPREHLRSRLGGARPRLGVPIEPTGAGGVVRALITSLWEVDDAVGPAVAGELEQAFVAALAASMTGTARGDRPDRVALRAAVVRHVRARLGDRALSVSAVCRRFGISPRTLHALFEESDRSFAATVRELRLDRCAALLADPAVTTTVTEIAASVGFDDPASFSRAFRRHFGSSPTEVRRLARTTPAHPR